LKHRTTAARKIRRILLQARHDTIRIGNLVTAEPPHIGRAGHLLFPSSPIFFCGGRAGCGTETANRQRKGQDNVPRSHVQVLSFRFVVESAREFRAALRSQSLQMNAANERSRRQLNVKLLSSEAGTYSTLPIFFTAAIRRALSSAMNFENSGASM
jgi:hypothetical protein